MEQHTNFLTEGYEKYVDYWNDKLKTSGGRRVFLCGSGIPLRYSLQEGIASEVEPRDSEAEPRIHKP